MRVIIIVALLIFAGCSSSNKSKNQKAFEQRVVFYLEAPGNSLGIFNYTPLSFSELNEYKDAAGDNNTSDTLYFMEHEYKGFNVANREVKRKAEVYFNKNYEVIGYRNIKYYNPLNKDSLKMRYRTPE